MRLPIFFLLICPVFVFGQRREVTETPSQAVDTAQGVDFRIGQSYARCFEERLYARPTPQGYTLAIPCYPETPLQNPLQPQIDSLKAQVAALQKMVETMQKAMITANSTGTTISDYPIGEPIRSWNVPRNGAQTSESCAHTVTTTTEAICPPGVKCNDWTTCAQCGKSWKTY